MWSRARLCAGAVLCLAVLVGCTSEPKGAPSDDPTPTAPAEVSTAAGTLRVDLEARFGLHAHLVAEAVGGPAASRKADLAAAEESATAVAAALTRAVSAGKTSDDLAQAWSALTAALAEVRKGADADDAEQAAADAADDAVTATLDVVGEGADQDGLEDLLRAPLETLVRYAQAVSSREREQSFELRRDAYAQMVTAGGTIAAGIIEGHAEEYPGPRASGALELRSALRQLLGEHAVLASTVARRGAAGAPDFDAAAAALNGNTTDLADALQSVYETPSSAFAAHWRDRISLLADYAAALGDKEDKAADRARTAVEGTARSVAASLAQATDDAVEPSDVAPALRKLDDALIEQTGAFADGELADADAATQQAYRQALKLADLVGEGIAAQQPDEFPST
jgi:hypothetical protein